MSSALTALGVEGGWWRAAFEECVECTDSAYVCEAFVAVKIICVKIIYL